MNQPATDAQLKQARRNQEFTNTPLGKGQCPLMQGEVAIFPVRYALDESPKKKGSNQGPNPLPKNWSGKQTELQTRSYTLRQLRDGWVYVWNSVDKTFHEYQVKGEMLIRHKWADGQLNKDERNNPGEAHPYLLYPRRSQLRIAYSPVQWTWRMCELMRNSATEQTQWMRKVDLPAFCSSAKVGHGAAITELGKSVADILTAGEAAPTFTSTLSPTKANETQLPFKAAFDEALVRGRVPEQDTALFVALDDPLALIDDLSMNLAGRLLELTQFEKLHQNKMQSALSVQNLCGLDADALIPSNIKDPAQRQAYTDDLYTLLQANDKIERGKDLVPAYQAGLVELGGASTIAAAETPFKAKWGQLPERGKWQKALDEWNAKRYWREDVRFDEVQKYLSQTNTQAQQLQSHCRRSELDLLTWLDKLSASAEAIYHDTCNESQSSELLEQAYNAYSLLSNGENGQKWLCKEARKPTTLFGMALYNFNPEVAALIKKVTHNFSTTGKLDDQGNEGDGSSPSLNPTSASDATNIATRVGEIKGVLDLQAVQDSKLYKAMSVAAKQTLSTLINVANNKARDAWHGLSGMLLPAMTQEAALVIAAPQVLISTEISSATQLAHNSTYQRDYQAWLQRVLTVNKKMAGAKGVLSRPGLAFNQRAARISLQTLDAQMKDLFLQRPNQIIAKASGTTRLRAAVPQINSWLSDLGQTEVITQLKIAGSPAYATRTKAWMAQNLGNALPALLVGLNAWNVYNTAKQAKNDGKFSADEWRNMGSSAAYAGNAIAALWVGPAWNRAGAMTGQLGFRTVKVAQAGYSQWLREAKAASGGGTQAAVASEFATVSKGLILRTMTWAALGVVATALEAWQLSSDIDSATSGEEKELLRAKRYVVIGMSLVAGVQSIGVGLGYWFGFAWVMSTPVTIILAILGIAYLMITAVANRYKREGLRLWLYSCSWGRGSKPGWSGDAGHTKQIEALLETLQRPSVLGRALYSGGGSTPRQWLGFWVQVQLPHAVAGKEVILQPAMIETNYFSKDGLQTTTSGFYEQFLNGNWVDPKSLGQLPDGGGGTNCPADFTYTGTEPHRLWQVWITTSTADPVLEMEVKYPRQTEKLGYVFRLALNRSTNEADRANTAFSGELGEKDGIVLAGNSTQRLKLVVPK